MIKNFFKSSFCSLPSCCILFSSFSFFIPYLFLSFFFLPFCFFSSIRSVIHSARIFIHSFIKYRLHVCYVTSTGPDIGEMEITQSNIVLIIVVHMIYSMIENCDNYEGKIRHVDCNKT